MPTPTEDLDRLLKDYDTSSPPNHWSPQTREPGCSRKALRRSFVVTFLCLVAVSIGWFLHITVFMDKKVTPAPAEIQNSFVSALGNVGDMKSNGVLELVEKSGILKHINMTSLVDYALKHVPAELASRLLSHMNDIKSGDFMALVHDAQLMDGLLDFLEFPDTILPGMNPTKATDDYDYENLPLPIKVNQQDSPSQKTSQNRETLAEPTEIEITEQPAPSQNVTPLKSIPAQQNAIPEDRTTSSVQPEAPSDLANFIQNGIASALNGPHWVPPPTATSFPEVQSKDIFRGRRRIVRKR